nr:MAG TPA: hypothetical protein [Caudoviricetes sp.]
MRLAAVSCDRRKGNGPRQARRPDKRPGQTIAGGGNKCRRTPA